MRRSLHGGRASPKAGAARAGETMPAVVCSHPRPGVAGTDAAKMAMPAGAQAPVKIRRVDAREKDADGAQR